MREKFWDYNLHIIFVNSPEYYESPVSLNEMGAAWVLKTKATSILLPGFGFSDMKGVIGSETIAIKLDADISEVKDRLNQLRRELESDFSISGNADYIWEEARDKFIQEINSIDKLKNGVLNSKIAEGISSDMIALLKKVADVPDGQIFISSDLESGRSIQIGNEVIAKEYPDRRQYAVWDEALLNCIDNGYVQRKNNSVCVITNAGYKVVDRLKKIRKV